MLNVLIIIPLRIPFFALLLLCSPLGFAQTEADYIPLADRLADYARLAMEQDVDGLLNLTDPALFEVIPREALEQHYVSLRSTDRLDVYVRNYTVDSIGEILSFEGDDFAAVRCHHRLLYRLSPEDWADKPFRQRLVRMLEKRYGAGQVRLDAGARLVTAEVDTALFAVRRGGAPWCFVEYRTDNAGLLDLVLPPSVRDAALN